MPPLRPLSLLVLTLGCGPDPRQTEAQRYVEAMSGAFAENAALARSTLELAEQVRGDKLDEEGAATTLEKEILPRARALATRARGVSPTTPALQRAHVAVVEAWSARADAYADLARAWHSGDLATFDQAANANRAASEDAADGLEDINAELSRYALHIDPYPSPPAATPARP